MMWNEKTISLAALLLSILALIGVIFWRSPRTLIPEGTSVLPPAGELSSPPDSFTLEGEVVSWDEKNRMLSVRNEAGVEYRLGVETVKSIYTAQGLHNKTPDQFAWRKGMRIFVYTSEPVKDSKEQLSAMSIIILK